MPMFVPAGVKGKRHMAATKSFLIGVVRTYGAKAALAEWTGTDDDAVAAIQADPREVFAAGCDHYDARGYCLGHDQ